MNIPYYKQEFPWSCFPACVKMILEYYGVKKSERDLRVLLKTTPRFGTFWEVAEKEIKRLGFELIWKKFWSLEELISLVKQSMPVIVGIKGKAEDNHAVILVDIYEEYTTIIDPENGESRKIEMQRFLNIWSERDRIAGYLKSG